MEVRKAGTESERRAVKINFRKTGRDQIPKETEVFSVIRRLLKNWSKWWYSVSLLEHFENLRNANTFDLGVHLPVRMPRFYEITWLEERAGEMWNQTDHSFPPCLCLKLRQWSFKIHASFCTLFISNALLFPIWYLTCVLLSHKGKQIGNEFRLEKLYLGTSSSYCNQMSHQTPRENSNNVIIWFPFQALCIFIYAKEFSKPSNWHSNRKTSFRAQVYKQTNSFCAGKLIPHNSKLPAARWTGRRGRESAHLSGRWSRWWSPLLTFQQSQK